MEIVMSETMTIDAPTNVVSTSPTDAVTTATTNDKKHKTISLCMIVKNEAHVIERCLSSVLPIIDYWVIVDTGSTDGTQQKIKDFFERNGIKGELHERPWVDFGHNRSEALELCQKTDTDYAYMIDADEILVYEPGFDPMKFKETLNADLYNIFAHFGQTRYHRPQMTSNKKRFYYRGVLHEYVDCHDPIGTRDFARGFMNTPIQDGARSSDPEKYKKDAEKFEAALATGKVEEKDFNRYHFYLAQSYRDSQQWEPALAAYLKRADLGGWNEEVFYSLYQAGRIMEILEKPVDNIIQVYFKAYQVAPWRAESLWAAARLCRAFSRFDQGYRFAKQGLKVRYPEGALFVGQGIYDWAMLDEFAIAAFWTGHYRESRIASIQLLQQGKFPPDQKERIEANLKFATDAILNEGDQG
jgi:glycosyltransferase involved in cell wall biosynthesis